MLGSQSGLVDRSARHLTLAEVRTVIRMKKARRVLPMLVRAWLLSGCTLLIVPIGSGCAAALAASSYPIVDTDQTTCYDNSTEIACPAPGAAFYGQDAQFAGTPPSYTTSDGLTVHDNVTGLTWQKSPDTNADGTIDSVDKMTWTQAQARPAALNASRYGGYNDWRLPTVKELYSLMNFTGTDVGPGGDPAILVPFIDRAYFDSSTSPTATRPPGSGSSMPSSLPAPSM
jgi:hypothetical protein